MRLKAAAPWPAASKVFLEGGQGCIESIPGTVRSSAGLRHSLLGKCAHSLWEGCVETQMAEVIGRLAVSGAGLIGGSFGIMGDCHGYWLKHLNSRELLQALGDNRPTTRNS